VNRGTLVAAVVALAVLLLSIFAAALMAKHNELGKVWEWIHNHEIEHIKEETE